MNSSTYLTYVALVISILALFFAWSAYNRAGTDLSTQVDMQLEDERAEVRQELAIAEARIRLAAIRAEIAAEEYSEEAAVEVAQIRSDLNEAYADATGAVDEGWQEMDEDLEILEVQIRKGSADALGTLDSVVESMRRGVDVTQKEQCLDEGGVWRQMTNSCVDSCEYRRNPGMMCAQVLTMGCDCGDGMCWNGVTCEEI